MTITVCAQSLGLCQCDKLGAKVIAMKSAGPLAAPKVRWKSLSCVRLFATPTDFGPPYSPWNSPGQNTRVGSLSLLQGIVPTQWSNSGLLHCRWILYQLSHQGSPRILEWVAYPFSSRSSRPRNWSGVSCTAGRFFTNWAIREASYLQTWT